MTPYLSHISMDFVVGLPTSEEFPIILVVVDRFFKVAHFISLLKLTSAKETAQQIIQHIQQSILVESAPDMGGIRLQYHLGYSHGYCHFSVSIGFNRFRSKNWWFYQSRCLSTTVASLQNLECSRKT